MHLQIQQCNFVETSVVFSGRCLDYTCMFRIQAFDRENNLGSNRFTTTYTSLKVMGDTVRLDLPVDGVTVEDGNWKILPLAPPRVSLVIRITETYYIVMQLSIPDGETCEPFRDFPECAFMIEWVGSGHPSTTLHHVVNMLGTADEDDFFVLHVNPGEN